MFKYASIFQELLFIIINILETYNIYDDFRGNRS